jgi:hypothetical protein
VETEGNNNLSKAGSQKGVFSSFYISGFSVIVAHPTSSWEEVGQNHFTALSNLMRLVLTGA